MQFEEVLSTQESADAATLEYNSRFRIDTRTTVAEGKARFGKDGEPGTLAVKPTTLAPDSRIQPGALLPTDRIHHRGTQSYARAKEAKAG